MIELTGIRIKAIACNVPDTIVDNLQVESYEAEKLEKIVAATGVRYRHKAPETECASDYSVAAAKRILKDQDIDVNDIGIVVFVSQSSDYILPATSCIIQDRLGLPADTIAFDVNLGCSGYVYGLCIVGSLLKISKKRYALLLAGDTNAGHVSSNDQSALFIFGDAGTATLLEKVDNDAMMMFSIETDGSKADSLIIKAGGARNPIKPDSLIPRLWPDGNTRADNQIYMDGMEIFSFAISTVVQHVKDLIENTEIYHGFVFHQANYFMLETMRKQIKIPKDKFLYSIQNYGNTSSASIPITICHNNANLEMNDRYLLCGFGVGLSWASADVTFDRCRILSIEKGV